MSDSVPTQPASEPVSPPTARDRLRLKDVRAVFRLVNDVRELGADPLKWRPHMIRELAALLRASIVVSSEVHFRKSNQTGKMRVTDIGWVGEGGNIHQIHTERDDERPEAFWLTAGQDPGQGPGQSPGRGEEGSHGVKADSEAPEHTGGPKPTTGPDELVPVKPARSIYGGTTFILSQVALPHAGAVDQLGLHREWGDEPFTRAEHRLVRLFHVELARLWKRDVLRRVKEPTTDLPPRLAQTLDELLVGSSEKQIARKLELSRHTIHNYVKALHQRFEVSSRGELLAKAGQVRADAGPRLSLTLPPRASRPKRKGNGNGGRTDKAAGSAGAGGRSRAGGSATDDLADDADE